MNPKTKAKFKEGDKVIVSSRPFVIDDSEKDYHFSKSVQIGTVGKLTEERDEDGDYILDDGFSINESCLTLYKDYKLKTPKFLLKYDLEEDPIEEFQTMPEVRKRIKELVEEEDNLDEESMIIYEIKSVKKVKISKRIEISK